MKRQIRRNCFETNSSSVHALQLFNKVDYDRWKKEDLYLYEGGIWCYKDKDNCPKDGKFYTKEEAIAFLKISSYPPREGFENDSDEELDELLYENDFKSYDNYYSNDEYEWEEQTIITPSGDEVIGVSYFGYYG